MAKIICRRGIAPGRHQLGTVGHINSERHHIVTGGQLQCGMPGDIIGIRRNPEKSQSAWAVSKDYRQTTHRALVGRLASGWAFAAAKASAKQHKRNSRARMGSRE
jgi:hypothetical protein